MSSDNGIKTAVMIGLKDEEEVCEDEDDFDDSDSDSDSDNEDDCDSDGDSESDLESELVKLIEKLKNFLSKPMIAMDFQKLPAAQCYRPISSSHPLTTLPRRRRRRTVQVRPNA
jgi:hypothetical protein